MTYDELVAEMAAVVGSYEGYDGLGNEFSAEEPARIARIVLDALRDRGEVVAFGGGGAFSVRAFDPYQNNTGSALSPFDVTVLVPIETEEHHA